MSFCVMSSLLVQLTAFRSFKPSYLFTEGSLVPYRMRGGYIVVLVQAMEVLSVVKARGLALGTSEMAVTELLDALAPVCNKFEEKMDFGLYFYNAE